MIWAIIMTELSLIIKSLKLFIAYVLKLNYGLFLSKDGNEIGFTLLAENFKSKSVNLRIWISNFFVIC